MKKFLALITLFVIVFLIVAGDCRGFGYIKEGNPIDTYVLKPIDEYVTEPIKDLWDDALEKIYEMK